MGLGGRPVLFCVDLNSIRNKVERRDANVRHAAGENNGPAAVLLQANAYQFRRGVAFLHIPPTYTRDF